MARPARVSRSNGKGAEVKLTILAGAGALLLTACATVNHTPLSPEKAAQLTGKTLASTQYPVPAFTAFTAGKAAFGMLGAAAMIAEGNDIVKANNIEDPALAISRGLVDRLATSRNGKPLQLAKVQPTSDEVGSLVASHPGVDYLVDVKTFNWMFNYYPNDWSHYRVTYSARARLIETSTRQVVAETMCQSVQGDDKNPPTKEQLLEKEAALLKDYLRKAADGCVEALSKQMLSL
jgi:hypothetical protein